MTQAPDPSKTDEWILEINNQLVELQQSITYIFQSFKRVVGDGQTGYTIFDESKKSVRSIGIRGEERDHSVWDEVFDLQSKYGMVRGDAIGQTAEGLYKDTETQYRLYEGKTTEQYLFDLSLQLDRVKDSVNSSRHKEKYDLNLLNEIIERTSLLERRVLKYHVVEPSVTVQPHVPGQLPAPIRVGVINDKLEIINTTSMTGGISPASFERLRSSLSNNLQGALIIVKRSNIDERFLAVLDDMMKNLAVGSKSIFSGSVRIKFRIISECFKFIRS